MSSRSRLSDERGWALVTAMLLMTIMLATIFSVATYVDGQTKMGANSRKRETAFNLAEAAMNMQVFALSHDWPGQGQAPTPYPTCTQGSSSSRCPNPTQVANLISAPDAKSLQWTTLVRDNGGTTVCTAGNTGSTSTFYSETYTLAQPAYDCNGDGRLWVRSQAIAGGKKRTVVELVRVEEQYEDLPHAAVIAGSINATNSGNKTIVDTTNSTGANGFVGVRCPQDYMGEPAPCLDQQMGVSPTQTPAKWNDLVKTQISPYDGHVQFSYSSSEAMSQTTRDHLKARAIADGTYFATCPPTLPSGTIVWIESGNCAYTSNTQMNSPDKPGLLLVNNGTLTMGGTGDYWGVIYVVNQQQSNGVVLTLNGSGTLHGGVFVDGPGIVNVGGTSKQNIKFEDASLAAIKGYGSAGLLQNTWREIKG